MKRTLPTHHAALVWLSLSACTLVDKNLGELASSTDTDGGSSGAGSSTGDGMTSNATSPETGGSETGEGSGCSPGEPHICGADADRDGVDLACDNAPMNFNPDQGDIDEDGVADVVDLCPTVAGASANVADSDHDGIGNECDSCRYAPSSYNLASALLAPGLLVRNIPDVGDADGDGIGDACDNCVAIPNCEAYDLADPWEPGDPIAAEDHDVCQRDDDQDMIGDACAGMQLPGAAGPVGFGEDDDFDQDGLSNFFDGCARLPVPPTQCDEHSDCPLGAECVLELGVCNHIDVDGDGLGDACDSCSYLPNAEQLEDGEADDPDADFIGAACELGASDRGDPLPMIFWSDATPGRCCTRALAPDPVSGDLLNAISGAPLTDPDGLPVRVDCVEAEIPEQRTCRALPTAVADAAGILAAPLGCNGWHGEQVTVEDVGGDLAALWRTRCELPQLDQDFDGIPDDADFCPFAFDPENLPYVDKNGMVWEHDGKYCNGEYSVEAICNGG